MTFLTLLDEFHSDLEQDGDTRVIWVTGDLDSTSAAHLGECLDEWIKDDGVRRLVLDLGAVGFIDAAGLHVLAQASRMLRARGQRLALRNPVALTPILVEVLQLAGVAEIAPSKSASHVTRSRAMRRTSAKATQRVLGTGPAA